MAILETVQPKRITETNISIGNIRKVMRVGGTIIKAGKGFVKENTAPFIVLEYFLLEQQPNSKFDITIICVSLYEKYNINYCGVTITKALRILSDCFPEKLVIVSSKGGRGCYKNEYFLREKIYRSDKKE